MKKVFRIIKEVIMWLAILFAFTAIGFSSETPKQTALIWAIIAIVIFGCGFLFAKYSKRKEETTKTHLIIKKIVGIVLLVFGLVLPALILTNFPLGIRALIVVFAIVLIALGIIAVRLINKGSYFTLIGYLLLVILAFLPALAMSKYDMSYDALGTTYYITIALACFAWSGIHMFSVKKLH